MKFDGKKHLDIFMTMATFDFNVSFRSMMKIWKLLGKMQHVVHD